MSVDMDFCQAMPKVALHDHLDGGLRPATMIELAAEVGHVLPCVEAEELAQWFVHAADSGSLVRYLETFDHTVAVMQTASALRRVAQEFVADQAADRVVYAEARWAPEQHLRAGLSLDEAVEAVAQGLRDGMAQANAAGRPIEVRQILTAMRHVPEPSTEIAQLAVTHREDLVCGFDIAGAEDGFPPGRFADSFELLRAHGMEYTIHAGEAAPVTSIAEAVGPCAASRIGHGARLVDDLGVDGSLGVVANYVLDRRIALELCPTSNVQTGVCSSIAGHPFGRLAEAGFRVTVNCDNRLLGGTTLSREFFLLSEAFGYQVEDLWRFTLNAAKAAFLPFAQRVALLERIDQGFAALTV